MPCLPLGEMRVKRAGCSLECHLGLQGGKTAGNLREMVPACPRPCMDLDHRTRMPTWGLNSGGGDYIGVAAAEVGDARLWVGRLGFGSLRSFQCSSCGTGEASQSAWAQQYT